MILHKEEKREKNRPSLRRVDSMDFLNQVDMEDDQEGQGEGGVRNGLGVPALGEVGRAMRYVLLPRNDKGKVRVVWGSNIGCDLR